MALFGRAGRRNAQRKLNMAYQVYQIEAPLKLTSFRKGKKEIRYAIDWRGAKARLLVKTTTRRETPRTMKTGEVEK